MLHVLYGISGAGKTTLGRKLDEWGLKEIVSHTTRPMRNGEINGIDYHFVDEAKFNEIDLVETTTVPMKNAIYRYGLSKKEVDSKVKDSNGAYAILNREGYIKLKALYPGLIKGIFVTIDRETAYERMINRGDSHESAVSRLEKFEDSFKEKVEFEDDELLLNINLDETLVNLKGIVNEFL